MSNTGHYIINSDGRVEELRVRREVNKDSNSRINLETGIRIHEPVSPAGSQGESEVDKATPLGRRL